MIGVCTRPRPSVFNIAFDSSGNCFVIDQLSGKISKITPTGTSSLFATVPNIDNVFSAFDALAVDSNGNLYAGVNQYPDYQIEKITPSGVASVFATLPLVADIEDLVFDSSGNLYSSDSNRSQIFKITPDGSLSVFATLKSGTNGDPSGLSGIVYAGNGNFYAADYTSGTISKVSSSGVATPFASLPSNSEPEGLAIDGNGNLFAADMGTGQISEITPNGTVSTYARNITRASYVAISPIPEPSTWAMLTLGIPALLATRRFRRRTY